MSILEKFHEMEILLKKEELELSELVSKISTLIGCNTYLVDSSGNVQCSSLPNGHDCTKFEEGMTIALKPEFKQRIGFVFETAANLPLETCFLKEDKCFKAGTFMSIVPIRNTRTATGHLLLTKIPNQFSADELLLAEVAALVVCIYYYENDSFNSDYEVRMKANAQMVLDSLSFSELKAISNVFKDLNGLEGFLVASKIADRIGISRSVIVNAMRKLESAGIVDSRSLGIKGTYVKIKNQNFLDALKARVK